MTAAIFGFFAGSWFGWAQEDPPVRWRPWLITGAVGSLLVAAAGGWVASRHWSDGTVFDEPTSRTFGVIVGVEIVLAVAGVLILKRKGRSDLAAPWVALVVGLHLFPLAPLFEHPFLYVVAALVTVAAVVSVPLAARWKIRTRAVTGVLTGVVLLVSAVTLLAVAA